MKKIPKKNLLDKIAIVMLKIAPRYGIAKAGVFGSLITGNFKGDSDIDILVVFRVSPGFVKFIKLENELTLKIGRRVDLVTETSLSPHFRKDVVKKLKLIYEKE